MKYTCILLGLILFNLKGVAQIPRLLKDIAPGKFDSNPSDFTSIENRCFFIANDSIHGRELWVTDGTIKGTTLVKDIYPGPKDGLKFSQLFNANGKLLFSANDGIHGSELWISDGTTVGTYLLKDIFSENRSSSPRNFVTINATTWLFISFNNELNIQQLWKTDGTAEGTVLIKTIKQISSLSGLNIVNGIAYFVANYGLHGQELWKSDGTEKGTHIVKDLNSGKSGQKTLLIPDSNNEKEPRFTIKENHTGIDGSSPNWLTKFKNLLFFTADDGINGRKLWKTDGTETGTILVYDLLQGKQGSDPTDLFVVDSLLYFTALGPDNGRSLYSFDGTISGTKIIEEYIPGQKRYVMPKNVIYFKNKMVFDAWNPAGNCFDLWISDGTLAGTSVIKDTLLGNQGSYPKYITVINNLLLYSADSKEGNELWRSDGTAAGTYLVKDICLGPRNSNPRNFFQLNGITLFIARDDIHGTELWQLE